MLHSLWVTMLLRQVAQPFCALVSLSVKSDNDIHLVVRYSDLCSGCVFTMGY